MEPDSKIRCGNGTDVQVRLLEALEQLVAGAPVATAAYAVGYESVSVFVAAFRDAFGEPPARYLRSGTGP